MSTIFDLEPNVVSVNILQYSIVITGSYGIGKTIAMNKILTKASPDGKKPLFLMFEDRYQHIDGIMAFKINKWQDLVSVLGQLKNPKAKERFSCVVIDTLDKFEELAMDFTLQRKQGAEILKDMGAYGEGTQRFRPKLHIIDSMRNLGFPVHFVAQTKVTVDSSDKANPNLRVHTLKLNTNTMQYCCESAYLIGYVFADENEERYITFDNSHGAKSVFGNNDTITYLKKSFENLPNKIKIDTFNDVLIDAIKNSNSNVTDQVILKPRVDNCSFNELKDMGMQLGNLLLEKGFGREVMAICSKELGEENSFDSLTENQYDLCELVVNQLHQVAQTNGLVE